MDGPVRSNVEHWKQLQEEGYFDHHPCYESISTGEGDANLIESFMPLRETMRAVVIGCGYGRETEHIARRVGHVYGIDVSERILDTARSYLAERSVTNFTPVLAERFAEAIPDGIDCVFSVTVMQHLTRDLVKQYFSVLGAKLTPEARMLVQFLEVVDGDLTADAELRAYEPSISWSVPQIIKMLREAGLELDVVHTYLVTPVALWHWVSARRSAEG